VSKLIKTKPNFYKKIKIKRAKKKKKKKKKPKREERSLREIFKKRCICE